MKNSALQSPKLSAKDALRDAVMALQRAQIETASLDARLLLEYVLGVGREALLGSPLPVTNAQMAQYQELIGKRICRQPVSQLMERREFWSMNFKVTPATLDPRPDSETLIEAVLEKRRDRSAVRQILDLGTGTGCLLLALLKEYGEAGGTGVDINEEALKVARENAANLGLKEKVTFIQSNWADIVEGAFDIIVANPPYIPTDVIAMLAPEVSRFEPKLALDGGADGLDCYRAIVPQLPRLFAKGGLAVFEIGMGQRSAVEELVVRSGLKVTGVKEDMAGIARCILIQ